MMQQGFQAYRQQVPQVPQRSPHAASQQQRRGGIGPMMSGGPHAPVAMSHAQMAQAQQAQVQASELAKRRSRKPTDKNIPEGVEECVVDPSIVQRYKDLRDLERRLDVTMTRKRLDVVDSVTRHSNKRYKTMRIWISNTVEDQLWQGNGLNVDAFDFSTNNEASYRVKIEGRLLDYDEDTGDSDRRERNSNHDGDGAGVEKMNEDGNAPSTDQDLSSAQPRFSHFFKEISVEIDRTRLQDTPEQLMEWKKPEAGRVQPGTSLSPAADFDEVTFKRSGDENLNITINLHRNEVPDRYQLTPELADVVDMSEATQQEAVMGLWEYIRLSGLQEDEEKRNFRCDEPLKKVIRRGDVGHIPLLNEYVTANIRPLPPISLSYTIRVDEEFHKDPQPTIYDVEVPVEDPLRATLLPLINNPQYATMLKDVAAADEQLARLVQAISSSKAKHSFFDSLSEDPATFIRNWLSSQKRDLEIIMGEGGRGGADATSGEEWRRGGRDSIWNSQNARESVNVLLSKQR